MFDKMFKGKFEGFFAWGQNPACSGANSNKTRQALSKLKWMVNVNLYDNETGSFWRGPGMNPKDIQTEVFLLPCASSIEKEGSISNSGRLAQWRYKAIEPVGESLPDGEIINELYFKVKELYEKQGGAYPDPIVNLAWAGHKGEGGKLGHIDMQDVAKEINGYYLADVFDKKTNKQVGKKGDLCTNFVTLQDDGTTSSGCWIYSGSYTMKDGKEVNMMARRGKEDPTGLGLYPTWAWTWPVNRRIIYNRASVDPNGNPWDPNRAVIKWDPVKLDPKTNKPGVWVGDIPDGPAPPMALAEGKKPFIMKPDGVGSIFGPGLADGPFPEHYEPLECPLTENPMFKKHRINPTTKMFFGKEGDLKEDEFATCDVTVPLCLRHLPDNRALADRPHDPPCPLAPGGRTTDVRGALQGAGQGEGDQERRKGERYIGPRHPLGHCDRHRPLEAVPDHGPDRSSGRHSLALRMAVPRGRQRRRQRQYPNADGRRSEHHDT